MKTNEELVDLIYKLDRIYKFLEETNDDPVFYHWKYRLDEINSDKKSIVDTLSQKSRVNC